MRGRWRRGPALERVWVAPVLIAAVVAAIVARHPPLEPALIAVGIAPWILGLAGRVLPPWLFGALGILPVATITALDDVGASMFLATATIAYLASRARTRWSLVGLAIVAVALPFVAVAAGHEWDPGAIYFAMGNLFGLVVGLLIGRTRRLGEELRAADARLVAAAAGEERARLARDVHDLVAHSLTVVVLQVGGARRVLRTDPAAAERALAQAEEVCRQSLDGIREVVGLLRSPDQGSEASLDLSRLAETYRSAGVDVDLGVAGDPATMPLLVRGTLYRVVREALSNAARYREPGTPVRVRVEVDPAGVAGSIASSGAAARRPGPGGFGLAGLEEQVAAIGGTLTSGPGPAGWVVEVRLPVTASTLRAGAAR